jgi:hypothetical protein
LGLRRSGSALEKPDRFAEAIQTISPETPRNKIASAVQHSLRCLKIGQSIRHPRFEWFFDLDSAAEPKNASTGRSYFDKLSRAENLQRFQMLLRSS